MFRSDAIGAPWSGALGAEVLPPPAGSGQGRASQVAASIDGVCNVPATASFSAAGRHDPASDAVRVEVDALRGAHPRVSRTGRPHPPKALVAAAAWQDDAGLRSRMKRTAYARKVHVDPRHLHYYVDAQGRPSEAMTNAIDRRQPKDPPELRNAVQALRDEYPHVFAPASVGAQAADPDRLRHKTALAAALLWHRDHRALLSQGIRFMDYGRRVLCGAAVLSKYVKADGTPVSRGAVVFRNVPRDLQVVADRLRAQYPDLFPPDARPPTAEAARPPAVWQPWASPWRPWDNPPAS